MSSVACEIVLFAAWFGFFFFFLISLESYPDLLAILCTLRL